MKNFIGPIWLEEKLPLFDNNFSKGIQVEIEFLTRWDKEKIIIYNKIIRIHVIKNALFRTIINFTDLNQVAHRLYNKYCFLRSSPVSINRDPAASFRLRPFR